MTRRESAISTNRPARQPPRRRRSPQVPDRHIIKKVEHKWQMKMSITHAMNPRHHLRALKNEETADGETADDAAGYGDGNSEVPTPMPRCHRRLTASSALPGRDSARGGPFVWMLFCISSWPRYGTSSPWVLLSRRSAQSSSNDKYRQQHSERKEVDP